MKKFGIAQWVFSFKLFSAAMLAYFISVRLSLPQSYWAVVTCVVVMNPTTGGVRSKALYRFTGTLCAGVAALLLASAFASIPLLMIISVGLVATAAFGWALLDRTPRSYGFQMFGITLMLIAVAGVDHPEHLFDNAVARICEIGLGIVCCSFVDSIIAPRSLSNALRQRLDVWLPDMQAWIEDAFQGRTGDDNAAQGRHRIIADISAMSVLAVQIRYDPMVSKWEQQCVFSIQHRLLRIIPMLSAIAAYIGAHRPSEQEPAPPWLHDAIEYVRDGRVDNELLKRIDASSPRAEDTTDPWRGLLQEHLVELVADVLHIWSEVKQIDASIKDERPLGSELERIATTRIEGEFHRQFAALPF